MEVDFLRRVRSEGMGVVRIAGVLGRKHRLLLGLNAQREVSEGGALLFLLDWVERVAFMCRRLVINREPRRSGKVA